MEKILEKRRKSYDKLDSVIVPITAFAGGILANVAIEEDLWQKASLVLFIVAILIHYLSIEAEAAVLKDGVKPNRRVNRLTGILNSVRSIVLTLGFLVLIIGVIGV